LVFTRTSVPKMKDFEVVGERRNTSKIPARFGQLVFLI
jgi:hypothetical protein